MLGRKEEGGRKPKIALPRCWRESGIQEMGGAGKEGGVSERGWRAAILLPASKREKRVPMGPYMPNWS